LFATASLVAPGGLTPLDERGWTLSSSGPFGQTWRTEAPGAAIEFDTPPCRAVGLVHRQFNGPMGRAAVTVDGQPAGTLDGWFEATWGEKNAATVVARDLPFGPHRVRVEVLPERAAASAGHAFEIRALLVAGTAS